MTVTLDNLYEKTIAELVELYNSKVDKPIKKFKDRPTAIRRVCKVFGLEEPGETTYTKSTKNGPAKQVEEETADEEVSVPLSKTKSKKTKTRRSTKIKSKSDPVETETGGPISWPAGSEIKHHRGGTRRGTMIKMMSDGGATLEQLSKATDWDIPTVRANLRMINTQLGHGIEEDEKGLLHLEGPVIDRKPFEFPAMKEIKSHRPGTKRAKTIELLSRKEGASIEEVMDANGWDKPTALEGVKLLHSYLGYGLTEDEEQRIYLTTS